MNSIDSKIATINLNEQRFIDINIDSDSDNTSLGQSETISKEDNKKSLFNFRKNSKENSNLNSNNTKKKVDSDQCLKTNVNLSTPPPNNQNNNNSKLFGNKISLNEATDILLANLNELNLNFYSDDDHDEDDDEEETNENIINEKLRTDKNLIKLHKKLQKLDSLSKEQSTNESASDNCLAKLNDHSTPLRSKSSCSIENLKDENMNEISLNCSSSSSDTNNKTLSHSNNESLNKKNSLGLNQKEMTARFHSKNMNMNLLARNDSIVDGLLGDIYDRFNVSFKESFDSDVFTEISMSSARFSGTESRSCLDSEHESESRFYFKSSMIAKSSLKHLSSNDLRELVNEMSTKVNQISTKLIRQLRQKDKLASKLNRNCDILTALLQAKSLKRRVDTQMKFTLDPMPGELGFVQWKDAMKALARLPGGIPKEFRKSVWLNLSQKYIRDISLDWNKVRRIAFNDRSNPDDDELGIQIVKDLHRTGCSTFSGDDNEQDRALLKRVLLAFARYNKSIGYCQGFNIIAALILEIVDKKEEDALMCMIYLVDHILPEGYFTNSMHSLAIDMAVFRELLKTRLPKLCQHLNSLQFNSLTNRNFKSSKSPAGTVVSSYEPPLTNVFTMQWFLTLFATCLPKNVLLRVWDCIYLEGAEILFRTSIVIWDKLSVSVMKAQSADAFYSMMSILTIKLFDQNVIDENDLVNKIYSYGSFPLSGISELREKFTFSITPFQIGLDSTNKSKKCESLSNLKLNTDNTPTGTLINTSDSASIETEINNKTAACLKNDLASLNKNEEFSLTLRDFSRDPKRNANKISKKSRLEDPDDEYEDEVEDLAKMISCFALLIPNRSTAVTSNSSSCSAANHTIRNDIMMTAAAAASSYVTKSLKTKSNQVKESDKDDISKVSPGAFSYITQMHNPKPLEEHLTLDLNELKKQYKKLKERQRQAHIIIQTASEHHRLKQTSKTDSNNNRLLSSSSTASQFNDKRTLIKSQSVSNTSTAHKICSNDAVINHLLIKASDPQCNLLKKPIQLNTDSSNRILTEPSSDDPVASIIKTDLARNSSIESYEKEVLERKRSLPKKKPIYYSDDEDDDDNEDDDDDEEENETNVKKNNSKISNSVLNETNMITFNEAKSLTLLDLSHIENKNDKLSSASSSLSSSSSVEDQNDRSNQIDTNNNYMYHVNDDFSMATQQMPKTKSSKLITSSIILSLASEEKRQMTPINPFPKRQIKNSNVAKNGMRLGLYK